VPARPFFSGSPGWVAIERLDLAFLVDRQHQRLVRRVEVKPDNVLNLLAKLRVVGELETARQMRLEPMRRPDALHARMAEADRLGHLAQRPVRALRRLFVERHGDDALDRRRLKRRLAPRPGRVSFEPGGAARDVTISPPADRSLGLAGRANNRRHARPLRPHQHDPRSPNQFLRRVSARHPALQPRPILRRQLDA
jgi:hypothetical protein